MTKQENLRADDKEILCSISKLKDRASILAMTAFLSVLADESGKHKSVKEDQENRLRDFTREETLQAIKLTQCIKKMSDRPRRKTTLTLYDNTIDLLKSHLREEECKNTGGIDTP